MSANEKSDGRRLTPANMLTAFRVIAAPIMISVAAANEPTLFLWLLCASFVSDAADGAVARLSQPTEFGARFDSLADAIAYTAIAISIVLLWPEVLREEIVSCIAIVTSAVLPSLLGLIKFGRLTSYHTWLVKLAVAAVAIGLVILLLGWATWPIRAAAIVAALAGLQEIAITLFLPEPRSDVSSVRVAWCIFMRSHKSRRIR